MLEHPRRRRRFASRLRAAAASVIFLAVHAAQAQAAPRSEPYNWKSVQMVGGGFVDGIILHPAVKGLSYARTDIGGAYRRDGEHALWTPITDWVSIRDVALMGPESIAVDPNDPNKLYIAAGMYQSQPASILRSNDRGKTFQRTDMPITMGGNSGGRGNGERMMVDPNDGNVIYFGSRSQGLWRSTDAAVTWENVASFPTAAPAAPPATTGAGGGGGARRGLGPGGRGDGIIFVVFDPASGRKGKASSTIYAGVSLTGQNSLFRSKDAGATWEAVPGQPTALRPTHGIWASDGTLYISFSTTTGPEAGTDGAVWKFDSSSGAWTDITPVANPGCGYAAVSVDAKNPAIAIASTAGHQGGEEIYRTLDAGKTWTPIINNPAAPSVYDYSGHPYTVHTGIHWLADIEIDPFDSDHAMFTVGYGGWETFNLSDIDSGKPVKWVTDSAGIEETVALSLLSPTAGAHLISAIGDYGGFVHWDLDKPAPEGNYVNPFFANTNDVAGGFKSPAVVVRVGAPGSGRNGGARGAIGYSLDAGKTWQPPKTAPAGNNGFIAVSADGKRWIWSVSGGGGRRGGAAAGASASNVTSDNGDTWTPCDGLPPGTRVAADTVNPTKFYAIDLYGGKFYMSTDGGLNFTSSTMNLGVNLRRGGDNRGAQDKIYATPYAEGDLWIAAYSGLFHSTDSGKTFARVNPGVDQICGFGFGKAAPGASVPAMFTMATIDGVRGAFRTDDGGTTWVRINDDDHQWGLVLYVIGDMRIYGRVYIGTHGRGTLYGDPLAARAQVEKTDDGVIVTTNGGLASVTVRAENVIHVQYAPDKSFFGRTSVDAVERDGPQPAFTVASDADKATVATSLVKAVIDLKTGGVSFQDSDGKTILAEKARALEAAEVQGEKTFHVRQQWTADPAESLYGMGELQLGFINIKDWDLDFWQHNGTVVSPFLVSNKGYGVLWDNTSFTRWGDLGAFEPIPATALIDDNGNPGGLSSGGYAADDGPIQSTTSTANIVIGGGNRGGGRGRGRGGRGGGGAIGTRWEGKLNPAATGDYQFQAYSNGTIRAWIDGKLVMDHFRQSWLPWYDQARVHLEAGKPVPIKIEWAADGQGNQMKFLWKPPVDRAATGTSLWSEVGDGIDYYFCYGPSIDRVIAGFRDITGKATMLPDWSFGYWQSKDHFTTAQQSIDAVKTFRDRKIPLDNIVQDWQYWPGPGLGGQGSYTFNDKFPDPVGWLKSLHDQHAHVMISVWGWISPQSVPNDNYQAMSSKNYLIGTGRGGRPFADFFNPAAAKLFWDEINSTLFSKGIDAWWLDGSEPDITGTPTLDAERTLMNPTAMGSGARMLNAYPLMGSKAVYEGQRAAAPGQRVFILTRSGFPGMQRYSAAVWSGDTTSTWDALRKQIMAGLGYSISGMPYWTMDIGGYQPPARFNNLANNRDNNPNDPNADEWDELNARWFEFGAFCPLFRVHGQGNRELYNFGPTAQAAMIKFDRLRYALMPYIYSLAGSVTQHDDTIMRPLVMDFTADAKACAVDDQYMFGPTFLVAPVTDYQARSRSVYLPQTAGGWYDFWSGKASPGGATVDAAAPYDAMPLFIKAGSIVPTAPVMQYVGEKPADPLTLYVYAGASGSFTLYEDEGVNFNYEKGAFTETPIAWDDAAKTLTIGARRGAFPGMLAERTFNVIFVFPDKPAGFAFDAKAERSVRYTGQAVQVKQ